MDKLQDFAYISNNAPFLMAQPNGDTTAPDHNFVLNTLHHLTNDTTLTKSNFWTLTQYALRNIRLLQNDLNAARAQLVENQHRIAQLEQLVSTDSLTGLSNRRGFLESLEQEMDRTNRGQTKGGLLIMIDLDNFKIINDTYGHQAGDEALKLVAQTLNAHIRKMDIAARLGGDEFVLIFSNANSVETSARLQKLARKLNSISLKWDKDLIPVRASIGIQSYAKGDSMTTIINKADIAMYKAKEQRKKD